MESLPMTALASKLRNKYVFIMIGWSVLIGASLAWNIHRETSATLSRAMDAAQSHIDKDIGFRKWVASNGGVYVPPTADTPSNPLLNVPERDVLTTDGKALTLLNPAYALRLLQDAVGKEAWVKTRITSLKPLNPRNASDPWETQALKRLERAEENSPTEVYTAGGQRHLRLMSPLIVEQECLKCHGDEGYKLGDIRGGISADISLQIYQKAEWESIVNQMGTHGLIWLLGLFGSGRFYRRESRLAAAAKLAKQQIFERDALFKNYFELGRVGMCITSVDQKWLRVNGSLCNMLGYSEQELTRTTWSELTHPDDLDLDLAQFKRLVEGAIQSYDMDKRFIHKSGHVVYVHLTVTCQRKSDGTVDYLIASLDDITERKQMEDKVRQLAFYDALTKLPNRRLLDDRLTRAMAASKRSGLHCALMFLDLDNFKPLNDRHGHGVGDLLLVEVAKRLSASVREVDIVARFGGDEFVVVLTELDVSRAKSTEEARIVAEKISLSLSAPYILNAPKLNGVENVTIEHECSASIGVVVFLNHEMLPSDAMKWADATMYRAKSIGRNSVVFYEAELPA